ncbi:MAG: reductase [Actinomycetia bacterium]|nr:reductase [Actinomycetes bacterium]
MTAPRTLLLIGGAGVIGTSVAAMAPALGWRASVVARSPRPDSDVLTPRDPAELAALVRSRPWDAVIDLRAMDADSTRVVINALPPSAHYVLVSTIYVYGHPRYGPGRSLARLSESAPARPTGPYGEAKLRAEFTAAQSLPDRGRSGHWHVVRLPFVAGPGDRSGRRESFIAHALSPAAGSAPHRTEVGLVSSSAAAAVLLRLLEARPTEHRVLNVDAGHNWTLDEHLAAARRSGASLAMSAEEIRDHPLPYDVGRDFSLDSARAYRLLALTPEDDIGAEWHRIVWGS